MKAISMDHQEFSMMEETSKASDQRFKGLYRAAAAAALLIVAAGLTDALTSMGVEAVDNRAYAITEWFALFQADWFSAFSRLGVINMITITLGIPVYLAFTRVFRSQNRALAAFAAILFFTGAAVYYSSNTLFSVYGLSRQYAAAPATQKPLLEAAAQALLAQGADLTPGTFTGLFFTQAAGLLITGAMLRGTGTVFSRWTGGLGLAGYILMIVFFVLTAFVPAHYATAMLIAAPGGLLLIAYQVMLARWFYQMGK